MKKSKTNAGHDKNNNENSSTPSIQKFFKSAPSAPKWRQVGKNGKSKDTDETKAVYTGLLKNKLRGKRVSEFLNQ